MTLLKVSESGQVYDIDLPDMKITPDQDGGFYLHGKGHWMYFETYEAAEDKRKEIEFHRGAF